MAFESHRLYDYSEPQSERRFDSMTFPSLDRLQTGRNPTGNPWFIIDSQTVSGNSLFSLRHFLSSVYNYSVPEPEDDLAPWRFCHQSLKNREPSHWQPVVYDRSAIGLREFFAVVEIHGSGIFSRSGQLLALNCL